jgi:hypothetical protein
MKFGLDQIKKPSPDWMDNFLTGAMVILGAFSIYVLSVPPKFIDPETTNFIGATSTFLISVFRVFQMFSGKSKKAEL